MPCEGTCGAASFSSHTTGCLGPAPTEALHSAAGAAAAPRVALGRVCFRPRCRLGGTSFVPHRPLLPIAPVACHAQLRRADQLKGIAGAAPCHHADANCCLVLQQSATHHRSPAQPTRAMLGMHALPLGTLPCSMHTVPHSELPAAPGTAHTSPSQWCTTCTRHCTTTTQLAPCERLAGPAHLGASCLHVGSHPRAADAGGPPVAADKHRPPLRMALLLCSRAWWGPHILGPRYNRLRNNCE